MTSTQVKDMNLDRTIVCIYENHLIRPLEDIDLVDGEIIQIKIRRKIKIKPIKLSHVVTHEEVKKLKGETWLPF